MRLGKTEKRILIVMSFYKREFYNSKGNKATTNLMNTKAVYNIPNYIGDGLFDITKPATRWIQANQACRNLKKKGLLKYYPRVGIEITEAGKEHARLIIAEIREYINEWMPLLKLYDREKE